MKFLYCQTHVPLKVNSGWDAIARFSPKDIIASAERCGLKGLRVLFCSARLKFFAKGGPCRTAKTPDFGLGKRSTWAMSPVANTWGTFSDSNVGRTRIKPSGVVFNFDVESHFGARAPVAHKTISNTIIVPSFE
mgnify:CR=1 FL=1